MDHITVSAATKRALFTASKVVAADDPFNYLTVPSTNGLPDGFDVAEVIEAAGRYRDALEPSFDDGEPATLEWLAAGDFLAILGSAVGAYSDDVGSSPQTADFVASWKAAANILIDASAD